MKSPNILCQPFGTVQIDVEKFAQYRVIISDDELTFLANGLNDKLLGIVEQVTIQTKLASNWLHVLTIPLTTWEAFIDIMNNTPIEAKHIHNFVQLLEWN